MITRELPGYVFRTPAYEIHGNVFLDPGNATRRSTMHPHGMTGADIGCLFVQSLHSAALESTPPPNADHSRRALRHFRTPDYGLEKELRQLVAIRESTDAELVSEPLRERYAKHEMADTLEHGIREISASLRT